MVCAGLAVAGARVTVVAGEAVGVGGSNHRVNSQTCTSTTPAASHAMARERREVSVPVVMRARAQV